MLLRPDMLKNWLRMYVRKIDPKNFHIHLLKIYKMEGDIEWKEKNKSLITFTRN